MSVRSIDRNLDIWTRLGKTDPAHTKQFQRSGGFKGTAIKPIYTTQKMTEEFGPCGVGWGFTEPHFQVVPGDNKEVLIFCWLSLWVLHDGKQSGMIPGVGGDKIVTHIKANEKYGRPERWENDDEAFKKAFTDAIGNAMKHLGMSADVHMGLFDDSKYVREIEREFAEEKTAERKQTVPKPPEPPKRIAPPRQQQATPFDDPPTTNLDSLISMGGEASERGSETLKVWWQNRTKAERSLIGPDRLAAWKEQAAQIDRLEEVAA